MCGISLVLGVVLHLQLRTDFTTLDGTEHRWAKHEGKWVVVNYFAEWCAPCLREIPELNHFYQNNKQDLAMYAVSFDPLDVEQLSAIQAKYDIQFPIIRRFNTDAPMTMPKNLPATYLIRPDGTLAKQLLGEQTGESLLAAIDILQSL
jgi:thiol-disulfide isomerase/thioredoxin